MKAATKLHTFKQLTVDDVNRFPPASLEYYLYQVERGLWQHRGMAVPVEMYLFSYKTKSGITHKTIFTNGVN